MGLTQWLNIWIFLEEPFRSKTTIVCVVLKQPSQLRWMFMNPCWGRRVRGEIGWERARITSGDAEMGRGRGNKERLRQQQSCSEEKIIEQKILFGRFTLLDPRLQLLIQLECVCEWVCDFSVLATTKEVLELRFFLMFCIYFHCGSLWSCCWMRLHLINTLWRLTQWL